MGFREVDAFIVFAPGFSTGASAERFAMHDDDGMHTEQQRPLSALLKRSMCRTLCERSES